MSKHTIPTELNIAPRGKSWLNGQLIDGEQGHPTRQSMESAERAQAIQCTCPSGDGSLQWPCPAHPPEASTLAAPAGAAKPASPTFMTADQGRDWAWNDVREYVGTEGWTVMDSVNFHGFFLYGWNYRGQYELQRTATRTAVMQEILSAAPAAVAVPDALREAEAALEVAIARILKADPGHSISVTSEAKALVAVRSALAATPAAAPAGWKLVPEVPTDDMIRAMRRQRSGAHAGKGDRDLWRAALAAAPAAVAPATPDDEDLIAVPRGLLGAARAVISGKADAPSVLEKLRRYTTGDLSAEAKRRVLPATAAQVVLPEPDAAIAEVMGLVESYADAVASDMELQYEALEISIKSKLIALLAGVSAPVAQAERKYICPVRTIADLVNNLMLMDQALPIYGAQYIEHPPGKRRAIAVPPTVSIERVKDSRWIGEGEALNTAIVWTRAEQPAAPQAQVDARDDSALLDAMERQRIALVPEYEGPWDAEVYNDDGTPNHRGSGSTPREAIRAAIAAQAAQQGASA